MTSITVLDELLGSSRFAVLAPEVVQLFRTARKRNSSVWGISQILEDFIGMEKQPRLHGPGIIKNATTKIIGQQHGDFTVLINHLFLNEVVLREIKNLASPKEATRTQGFGSDDGPVDLCRECIRAGPGLGTQHELRLISDSAEIL